MPKNVSNDSNEDSDVKEEREKVKSGDDFILRIKGLTKVFRRSFGENNTAVDNITVGIKTGEVCLSNFVLK